MLASFNFAWPPPRCPWRFQRRARIHAQLCDLQTRDSLDKAFSIARERRGREDTVKNGFSESATDATGHSSWSRTGVAEGKHLRRLRTRESLFDYIPVRTLSTGTFSDVYLVRSKDDGRLCVLKAIRKDMIRAPDRFQYALIRAERDAMAEADSEWLIKLRSAFQTSSHLYLTMDYLRGGDLGSLLDRCGTLTEGATAFCAAEITLGIEALHSLGYMHRDLKPDNVLITATGHIKLADFGFAKSSRPTHDKHYYNRLLDPSLLRTGAGLYGPPRPRSRMRGSRLRATSRLGTPGFIAPEVLSRREYSNEADFYPLGVIIYRCLVGRMPIEHSNTSILNEMVVNCDPWQLLSEPHRRLGRKNGTREIKNHAFFQAHGIDFDGLLDSVPPTPFNAPHNQTDAPQRPPYGAMTGKGANGNGPEQASEDITSIRPTVVGSAGGAGGSASGAQGLSSHVPIEHCHWNTIMGDGKMIGTKKEEEEDVAEEMALPFVGFEYRRFEEA
ncbi:hypothetical protein VTJ83DRAFT_3497 [Remersonia thermophila]|uniref:non-specific serine/threonine protein kinase n=1 Tax=Remersonia thermophila TaxID=72144 RepID=A0ABR4DE62_9PEZI